ncbi:MAG: M18 family aminopeptidase, partial [Candidatus Neoclostridium sp.]
LSDPTNKSVMGGGIVVKHHANKNYTTDGLSSAVFEQIMQKAGVKTQHFFMRSDLRCGSTLGTIALTQLAIKSVDIGLAQLAMHSSMETMCAADVDQMVKGLSAFYESALSPTGNGYKIG